MVLVSQGIKDIILQRHYSLMVKQDLKLNCLGSNPSSILCVAGCIWAVNLISLSLCFLVYKMLIMIPKLWDCYKNQIG